LDCGLNKAISLYKKEQPLFGFLALVINKKAAIGVIAASIEIRF